jgi:hypothetical protein
MCKRELHASGCYLDLVKYLLSLHLLQFSCLDGIANKVLDVLSQTCILTVQPTPALACSLNRFTLVVSLLECSLFLSVARLVRAHKAYTYSVYHANCLAHFQLGRRLFTHLKVYKGAEHPHEAQKPVPLPIRDKRIKKSD